MSGLFRILFLLSSFGPLYAVVAAELYVQRDRVDGWLIFAACFAVSIIIFLFLQRDFESKSPMHSKVIVIANLDENILTYIVAYLPPLFVDDFSKPEKMVPTILFYLVLSGLMARTDTMYVNPYFLLFGYRVYRVQLESGREVTVVTRMNEISPDRQLTLYEIDSSKFYYAA